MSETRGPSYGDVCRDYMAGKCARGPNCRFKHDDSLCRFFWAHGNCPDLGACPRKHVFKPPRLNNRVPDNSTQAFRKRSGRKSNKKNTESFEPMLRPVDMRIVLDLGSERLSTQLTTRDVLLAPNLFSDFPPGELYARLADEILNCGVPQDRLLKLWHGDTHFIADDHTPWKRNAPTFNMVLSLLDAFFGMDTKATRFNWYKDTSHWKPFHHDAAQFDDRKAQTQNITVAVSFGATRDVAFEDAKTRTVVSLPQPDGCVYAFCRDTNVLWRHGILKEGGDVRDEGRISIICWSWLDGQTDIM